MKKLKIIIVLLVLLSIGLVVAHRFRESEKKGAQYRVERVNISQLRVSVGATGTINPVMVVHVGTQISGTIKELYVDFNDNVKAGDLLMILDDQLFKAKADMSKANLASAQSQLRLSELKYERQKKLFQAKSAPKEELDTAEANLDISKATVNQHEASLAQDLYNLNNTRIISPVEGVVINRAVDVGQTVAASFQTPTLVDIAGDLTKMQINASFAEADVGRLIPGLEASFTVDAYPGRSFKGKLRQIRLNPTVTSNVVTYDVVIDVDNPEKILLPGMTAYVDIELFSAKNVLLIPNSALNFRPAGFTPPSRTTAVAEKEGEKPSQKHSETNERPRRDQKEPGQTPKEGTAQMNERINGSSIDKNAQSEGWVFILDKQNQPKATKVILGATDLRSTVVKGGDLKEGDFVIISENNQIETERALIGGPPAFGGGGPRRR